MAKVPSRSLAERLAQPIVELGVRLGSATREIGEALSRAGIALEASSIKKLEESIQVERAAISNIFGETPDTIIDPANLPEALTKLRRQYSFTSKVDYINKFGARAQRYINISTNELMSERDVIEETRRVLERDDYEFRQGGEIGISIVRAVKAGMAGTL